MFGKKISFCFYVMILAFTPTFGNSLEKLINLSYENELLNISKNEIQKSILEKESTAGKYLPKITLEGGYIRNDINKFITEPSENFHAGVVAKWLLFDGFSREANLNMLDLKKDLAKLGYDAAKNKIAYEITKLYFTYNALLSLTEYKKQYSNYLKNATQMVEKLNKVGLKSLDELKILEANYQLALTDENDYQIKLNNVLLNIEKLTNQKILPKNDAILLEADGFEGNSIDLQILNKQIDLANQAIRKSHSHHYPSIFLANKTMYHQSKYGIDMPSINPPLSMMINPMIDDIKNKHFKKGAWHNSLMIGFKYDLFSFGANSKQTQIDKINYLSLKNKLDYEKRALKLDNENLKLQLLNLKNQIKANDLRDKAANTAFLSMHKKYEAGLISYVEYLNALELKFKASAALELSKSNYEITKAKYYYINGINILDKVRVK